ncbi:17.82 kDa coat protein [Rubber tree latent virus 1]|nr:17.82 kDa coat protein [Rubber tree latent virus 1]WNV36293.1 coat protein [Rubber tree latent virus 1]
MPYLENERLECVVSQLFISQKELAELLVVLNTLSFSNKSERVSVAERLRTNTSRIVTFQHRFPSQGQYILVSSSFLSPLLSILFDTLNFSDSILASGKDDGQIYAALYAKARERFYAVVHRLATLLSLVQNSELVWVKSFNRASFELHYRAVWKE